MELLRQLFTLATTTKRKFPLWPVIPLILFDVLLTSVIVLKVPCMSPESESESDSSRRSSCPRTSPG